MNSPASHSRLTVAALYRFCRMEAHAELRRPLTELCRWLGIRGTLLLAPEGINGTVAGPADAIEELLRHLRAIPGLEALEAKLSAAAHWPFYRMKVRLKREIVTMGVEGLDPVANAGTYVEPTDWNRLVDDPETVLIDTRNDYEVALGTFRGAVDPRTRSFREFAAWAKANREAFGARKVAMFCTGGIRCEKATALMRTIGIDDVYHLRGGILKYLEEVPASESRWTGECFVFDERVSVVHGLAEGEAELCRACRHPVTPDERRHPEYREGVSCPHCHGGRSEEDRARYAERQRQVRLAEQRGASPHIGQRPRVGSGVDAQE
jgi:UPF0176 protein